MPIKGLFEWEEKKDTFVLRIPLKGVSPSKVDIFATKSTLKVNYSPYLVDVVLYGEIDHLRHKATVKDGTLTIKLSKLAPGMWGRFHVDADNLEGADVQRKAEALAAHGELEKELKQKRLDRKSQDERFSTKKQMALEEAERSRLEDLKLEEKQQAEEELYAAIAEQEKVAAETKVKRTGVKGSPVPIQSSGATPTPAPIAATNKKFDDIDSDIDDDEDQKLLEVTKQQDIDLNASLPENEIDDTDDCDVKYIPPPRSVAAASEGDSSGKVNIKFTPRIFPTPMRASKAAEEEDWIAKNRKHLKNHGVFGKTVKSGGDVTEEDPAWLKAKGDDFYRSGDCRSAINAYSAAIDINEKMTASYSNRSACYLKLGMDHDCTEDCTVGIRLLEEERGEIEPVDGDAMKSNNLMTVKLMLRRGISQCRLGNMASALQDYSAGLDILKQNTDIVLPGMSTQQVSEDVEQLEKIVYADEKKKEADILFGQRDLNSAVAVYTEVLEVIPEHIGCLANRSACKIALGDMEGCVQDCNAAINYLQSESHKLGDPNGTISTMSESSLSMLYAVVPAPGSEKRKNWLMKTVVRRGAVSAQLGNLDDAVRDYGLALSLDPTNAELQTDLQNLVNTRSKRAQQGIGLPVSAEPSAQ